MDIYFLREKSDSWLKYLIIIFKKVFLHKSDRKGSLPWPFLKISVTLSLGFYFGIGWWLLLLLTLPEEAVGWQRV